MTKQVCKICGYATWEDEGICKTCTSKTDEEIDAIATNPGPGEWETMALAVCHKIESMGCSEALTELSVMANELRQSIAAFNRSCDVTFERMCAENPDLEPILRGRKMRQKESNG